MRAIATRFDVSPSFVKNLLRRYRDTGSLEPRPHGGGRPRAIPPEHEHALRDLLDDDNDLILIELVQQLRERHGIVASKSSVDRALVRLDLTRKKRALLRLSRNASNASEASTGR